MMRPLGKTQRDFLTALADHGAWHRGCGWIWANLSTTERLIASLVRRGMVEKRVDGSYHLTDDAYLELFGNLSDAELLQRVRMWKGNTIGRKYREAAKRRNLL